MDGEKISCLPGAGGGADASEWAVVVDSGELLVDSARKASPESSSPSLSYLNFGSASTRLRIAARSAGATRLVRNFLTEVVTEVRGTVLPWA